MKYVVLGLLLTQIAYANGSHQEARQAIKAAAHAYRLSPRLLLALCTVESSLNPAAINPNDGDGTPSLGLCQVKVKTARWLGFEVDEADLLDPHLNAMVAAHYLAKQKRRYRGDVRKAVSAFNAGTATAANEGYVNKVMEAMK
jgi:soluble lytic murein transglycosylase-like protein